MEAGRNRIAALERQGGERAAGPGPLRFVAMAASVALAVLATTYFIAFVIPDSNDYALASILKHERLASLPSPKIVLVGGSNLSYGIDSAIIEGDTRCGVVNMGMNGYLGARLMLAEIEAYLKESDIVVVSLEYQNFFDPVDGHATDQFMLAKANPDIWRFLTWRQKMRAILTAPMVAQQKVFRIIRSAVSRKADPTLSATDLTFKVETFSGFEKHGDLTSHLDLEWPYADVDRFDLSNSALDPDVIPLLRSFAARMGERGVRVIYSYSPVKADFHETHRKAIGALHDRIAKASPLSVPQPPETFVFDKAFFFDSIYHLNAKGRALRSRQLAIDIRRTALNGEGCVTRSLATNGGR